MLRVHLLLAVTVLSLTATLSGAEPRSFSRFKPRPATAVSDLSNIVNTWTYTVRIAEPVPDEMFRVEYRYLETDSQEGSDWLMYTVTADEDSVDDAIFFIATKLIAEIRVTEFKPSLQWETVGTYDSFNTADLIADGYRAMGYHVRIDSHYSGEEINLDELELQLGPGF